MVGDAIDDAFSDDEEEADSAVTQVCYHCNAAKPLVKFVNWCAYGFESCASVKI